MKTLASRKKQAEHQILVQKKRISDATAHLNAVKEEEQARTLKVREKENLFNASEESLKKRRGQLSEAKNNKEYQSLRDQITLDQRANDLLADEVLEMDEELSKFQKDVVEAARKELDAANEGLATAERELAENAPVIDQDMIDVQEKLKGEEEKLPRDFKGIYQQLVKGLGGENSLAPVVEKTFCGNCRQQVPIQFIAQLSANKPYVCMSCGRLLYLPEGYSIK